MAQKRPALAAVCGSLRSASFNRKLLREAVAAAESMGVPVDVIELRELNLPLYDGDLESEHGLPQGAIDLKARLDAAQGLLVACPEYNHSIPGTFKNAIDWSTRGGTNPYSGKTVALMGAATGAFGAVRSLQHLRQVFISRGAWLCPAMVLVPQAATAFDEAGRLKDPVAREGVESLVKTLIEHI